MHRDPVGLRRSGRALLSLRCAPQLAAGLLAVPPFPHAGPRSLGLVCMQQRRSASFCSPAELRGAEQLCMRQRHDARTGHQRAGSGPRRRCSPAPPAIAGNYSVGNFSVPFCWAPNVFCAANARNISDTQCRPLPLSPKQCGAPGGPCCPSAYGLVTDKPLPPPCQASWGRHAPHAAAAPYCLQEGLLARVTGVRQPQAPGPHTWPAAAAHHVNMHLKRLHRCPRPGRPPTTQPGTLNPHPGLRSVPIAPRAPQGTPWLPPFQLAQDGAYCVGGGIDVATPGFCKLNPPDCGQLARPCCARDGRVGTVYECGAGFYCPEEGAPGAPAPPGNSSAGAALFADVGPGARVCQECNAMVPPQYQVRRDGGGEGGWGLASG